MSSSIKKKQITVPQPPKLEDHAEFYTLSAAVYSALADIQADEAQFEQFLHYAMDGYKEFHFDASHQVELAEIELLPWKQIKLPPNYVDWCKVAFKEGDLLRVLTRDPQIAKTFNVVDGVPQENLPTSGNIVDQSSVEMIPLWNHCGWGTTFYGIVSRNNGVGYFDVDLKRRVMNFKDLVAGQSTIYLEFISDGINYSGQTIIHPYVFRLIKLWIHWQRKENDDRVSESSKERAKRLFETQFHKVNIRQLDLTLDDIREALRSGHKQTPKL